MRFRSLFVLLVLLGLLRPVLGQAHSSPAPQPMSLKHLDGRNVVFVVDGAGESTAIADTLSALAQEMRLPIVVQSVRWCRGVNPYEDDKDVAAQVDAARRLTGMTLQLRKDCPHARITLLGNSSGTRIVLLASEMLPAESVDRIILMGPTVKANYDLRPALRASRGGIDHFWSTKDNLLIEYAENTSLTKQTSWQAAGAHGFRLPPASNAEGFDAYRNLRQYCWRDGLDGCGGHFAWMKTANVRNYVVPMLFQPSPVRSVQSQSLKR